MKRLTLLRHAKSSWANPRLPDAERPLSGRGERDAPEMAQRLQRRGERPELILTSHALRAIVTARIVAAGLGCPPETIRVIRPLYLAAPDTILDVARSQDEAVADMMIVGHNPGLTDLANRLLPTLALDNLPTAGVIAIDSDAARWVDIETADRRLLYYDYPKNRGGMSAP